MKHFLKINSEVSMDVEKLIESRAVILANSGGGKSWAIRRFAEQSVEKVQTIIIDPEGEFSTLREKFDFILCGKNADVPVEVRSASLLATKLLEIGKSAIIDLYELSKQDRQRFVKIFFNTMVDAPKELYHPVFIILDEAHDYAPEGKPSEATQAVEDLASKGRKRGYCLIPASQRIAKLSKNLSAECNNKFIGRATQDIDYIRAGAELGFNKADSAVRLRNLKPGEFYAFGPAISDEITKIKIGDVKTTHAKVGYKGVAKVPPASSVIKKVLDELKDLPQEAEKEAKTLIELKAEIKQLKSVAPMGVSQWLEYGKKYGYEGYFDSKAVEKRDDEWKAKLIESNKASEKWRVYASELENIIQKASETLQESFKFAVPLNSTSMFTISKLPPMKNLSKKPFGKKVTIETVGVIKHKIDAADLVQIDYSFGKCARAIATYLYDVQVPKTKTQVAVAVGYSQNSGGFNNAISELVSADIVSRDSGMLRAINEILAPELKIDIDPSLHKWLHKLGACSRAIWGLLLEESVSTDTWTKEQVAEATNYSPTSGGFNNSISELSSLGLIERLSGGLIRINPEIL